MPGKRFRTATIVEAGCWYVTGREARSWPQEPLIWGPFRTLTQASQVSAQLEFGVEPEPGFGPYPSFDAAIRGPASDSI
jgi:hypothetical protein